MKRLLTVVLFTMLALMITACSGAKATLISPDAYVSQFTESNTEHILIDVRTDAEFRGGHIAGAINIPVDDLAMRLDEIPSDVAVIVYCQSGNRSGRASRILEQNNYLSVYDLGGISNWISAGYPVE